MINISLIFVCLLKVFVIFIYLRTIEEIKTRLKCSIGEEPNETEIMPKNKILDTLNLLRSSNIIPVEELGSIKIELDDFKEALKKVVPSSKREGFVTVPNITWDDIGSLKKIRQELHMAMLVSLS